MAACHVTCGKVTDLTHATLDHATEHEQVRGSHLTLNVQHESLFNYTRGPLSVMGGQHRPKTRLA